MFGKRVILFYAHHEIVIILFTSLQTAKHAGSPTLPPPLLSTLVWALNPPQMSSISSAPAGFRAAQYE